MARARIAWVKLVQWPFLVPATAAMFLVVFVGTTWLLMQMAQETGSNRTQVLLIVALVMIMFFFGLVIASYQQRLSKRLKLVISEQDQILASVLTNSVDAVIVFDNEEKIQMWNRGAHLTFGYTPEEILGQPISTLLPSDMDSEEELARMNKIVAEQGYMRNYIARRVTKDGRRITVDISRTPFRSGDGQFVGHTAVVKDVTDKLELDQKMYNAEKLASIGLLASGVAHEINNPLTIILGFTELLKDKFDPSSAVWDDLDKIENNANQAKKIVEDLLGFSRAKQGVEQQANLHESVTTLTDFVSQTRIAKKVELETDVASDLPQVNADPREIQQVLLNLINNAVAAINSSTGVVRICASQIDDSWVELRVTDTGKGIPAEIRTSVFDPFFTTKEFGEGTGLGLSLCYGLVKKWGGTIDFDSHTSEDDPDKVSGTVFKIRIPVYDAEFNPEAAS